MAEESRSAQPIRFDEEENLGSRGGPMAWAEYALTRFVLGVTSRLPFALQDALGSVLAHIAIRLDKRHSDAARKYIAQALGPEAASDDRFVLGAYRHLFRMSVESDAFNRKVPQSKIKEYVDLVVADDVREELSKTTGGIMVTAHVGDWEAGAARMPYCGMSPSYVLAKPPKNRYLSRHLLRIREKKQVSVIPRRGGMRQIAAILDGGGWIAMLLDQRPSGKYAVAPFFGKMARCERSAAVLIKRLGVPLVFGACYMTERRLHSRLECNVLLTADEISQLSLDEVVARINRELETVILRHPEQYLWLHDRYRDAPQVSPREPSSPASGLEDASAPEGRQNASHVNSGR